MISFRPSCSSFSKTSNRIFFACWSWILGADTDFTTLDYGGLTTMGIPSWCWTWLRVTSLIARWVIRLCLDGFQALKGFLRSLMLLLFYFCGFGYFLYLKFGFVYTLTGCPPGIPPETAGAGLLGDAAAAGSGICIGSGAIICCWLASASPNFYKACRYCCRPLWWSKSTFFMRSYYDLVIKFV